MDGTTGDDTMTPPHDNDTPTEEFAPVIPLRRRQHQPDSTPPTREPQSDGGGGIWDTDTTPANLTARRPPVTPSIDLAEAAVTGGIETDAGEDSDPSPAVPGTRTADGVRRPWGRSVAAGGVLAIAAAALVTALAVTGGASPHASHLATAPPTSPTRHAGTHAAKATKPKTHTHTVERRLSRRPRTQPGPDPKLAARKPAAATGATSSLTVVAATEPTTQTTATTQTAQTPPPLSPADQTPVHQHNLEAAKRRAAAACVPGELGC